MSAQRQYMEEIPQQNISRNARIRICIQDAERFRHLLPELEHIWGPLIHDLSWQILRTPEGDRQKILTEIGRGAWTVGELCTDSRLPRDVVVDMLRDLAESGRVSMRIPRRAGSGANGVNLKGLPIFCLPSEPYGDDFDLPKPQWNSAFEELMSQSDE